MGFIVDQNGASIEKQAGATLDYTLDLSRWLAGDRVSGTVAPVVTVPTGDVLAFSAARNAAPIAVVEDGDRRVIPTHAAVVLWLAAGTLESTVQVVVTTEAGRVEVFRFTVVIV